MPNRLSSEPGLYLRQHGDDPVDWYPWGEPALAAARAAGKPILLSIGYSACHWCHVMARESFSDPAIAALMNEHYVSIKVDREERPDLDQVYQLAHQALQRRGGGWPLTAFVDPETLLPFFVGTYFPPERRHGLPAFREVLLGLSRWFDERPAELDQQAQALAGFLRDYGASPAQVGGLDLKPLAEAQQRWLAAADAQYGGHRGAPKFPHAGELALALVAANAGLREHARHSLLMIARGGLQDHLGGGFFRYCVDADWGIPHFEKMLYDNAQLLPVFAAAARAGDAHAGELRAAAIGIVRWLQEEMSLPDGGFAAALDADSEHHEGRYYLWQADAVGAALPAEDAAVVIRHFGLDGPANFEDSAWHLRVRVPLEQLAGQLGEAAAVLQERVKRAARLLRLQRAARVAPARDDKCIASWNGLLLSGLARAGHDLARGDWLDLAQKLAQRLRAIFWRDGRLYSVANAGVARQPAFLDDHAAILCGLLDLLQARWRSSDLEFAVELAEELLTRFEDQQHGGFWLTAHDQPALPQRPKPWLDESTPAGNGLAAQGLLRLGALVAEPRYLHAAERCLRAGWSSLSELPQAAPAMLAALLRLQTPAPLLIVRQSDQNEMLRWREALRHAAGRAADVFTIPASEALLPEALVDKRWMPGGRVYWCEGLRCLPRFDSPVALAARLDELAPNLY